MVDDNPSAGESFRHILSDSAELFWLDHCEWLKEKGYLLRPRYQPGWVPSWIGTTKKRWNCEDGKVYNVTVVMDATRISDGTFVMLKYIETKFHPHEIEIGTWFSQEPQASDPDNHCVPILEVLDLPDIADMRIIVMPMLRNYDKPRFDTFGEVVQFFSQILKGLRYMHRNNVAHRDCMSLNVMMDGTPLYPIPYHPVEQNMKRDFSGRVSHLTRTQRPVKYYITDFGLSRRYPPGVHAPLEPIIVGGDKSVPEFRKNKDGVLPMKCDPFPTDVYYIGNLIRSDFLQVCTCPAFSVIFPDILFKGNRFVKQKLGFEFMEHLVNDMVQDDPSLRPTMDEVVERFEEAVRGLSQWKLRSRVVMVDAEFDFYYAIKHWMRKLMLIVRSTPAIPTP
ncbi:hypothetical protein B0H10DRAFT_1784847 [Mycena sp. CBHHK59/15]|nr:hypothetical protein B0H10DRAFT_1784847 [Mycena sp. CBHHK59/15]